MSSVTQGLEFGIAVAVILFGVRTILGELIPAFQGIANKVVPGAIPALDCPIVFLRPECRPHRIYLLIHRGTSGINDPRDRARRHWGSP